MVTERWASTAARDADEGRPTPERSPAIVDARHHRKHEHAPSPRAHGVSARILSAVERWCVRWQGRSDVVAAGERRRRYACWSEPISVMSPCEQARRSASGLVALPGVIQPSLYAGGEARQEVVDAVCRWRGRRRGLPGLGRRGSRGRGRRAVGGVAGRVRASQRADGSAGQLGAADSTGQIADAVATVRARRRAGRQAPGRGRRSWRRRRRRGARSGPRGGSTTGATARAPGPAGGARVASATTGSNRPVRDRRRRTPRQRR